MNYFDLHCDTAYKCYTTNQQFYVNQLAVSGSKGKKFNNWKQVFAIWVRDNCPEPFFLYKKMLEDFKIKLKTAPNNLTPYFAVEGGAVLQSDLNRLYTLKSDGIKFLTLTWNGENAIAGGANTEKGLTSFGKSVIEKMNELKIGCDLSHLNEKSFYKAVELAHFPLATHSNCFFLKPHRRNLTDNQIKLIAQKNGVVGLCFFPDFLCADIFEAIYRNIFHLLEMGLENSISIGSDFDGGKMSKKLDSLDKIPHLFDFLAQKGLETNLLDKIFYKNANNYIAKL